MNDDDDGGRYGKVDMAHCGVTAILLSKMFKYSCSICCVTTITLFHMPTVTHTHTHTHCGLSMPAEALYPHLS